VSTYAERKQTRKEWFFRFRFGMKERPCGACSGSGRYDSHGSPRCGACDGTGRERYRDPAVTHPDLDPVWNQGTPMPEDYTCGCGIYVHPSVRNLNDVHIADCPYRGRK
jgi:hypothetical protein